jgi:signal transduction histidine kinase
VVVRDGEDVSVPIDADQIEQVLINVMRNAVDASIETGGTVSATWWTNNGLVEVCIEDEGPGLQNTANLFVPFFTTKQDGSGIGLALSRQITEAHGGTLTLENRDTGRGARAVIRLPA